MNALARRHLVAGAGLPSGPSGDAAGRRRCSGTKTVPPLLTVWSTPWSKNWPKNVNSELYGGERPTSVVTFGMNSVWCDGTQPAGDAAIGGPPSGRGRSCTGTTPGLPWVRTGNPAAATAAGLVEVWSTIRLLMTRGCESKTLPVLLRVATSAGTGAPGRRAGGIGLGVAEVRRRQPRERLVRGGERLAAREQVVARAVDGAQAVRRSGGRGSGPGQGPTSVPQGLAGRQRRRVALGDLDLLEDERQVAGRHREALADAAPRRRSR